jgi:hypothetical protein
MWRPLAVLLPLSLLLASLLIVINRLLVRVFPILIGLYFSYFSTNNFILKTGFGESLSVTVIIVFFLAISILLCRVDGERAAIFTFIIALVMASATLIAVVPYLFYDRSPRIDANFSKETLAAVSVHRGNSSDLPDIIYVIPDRYASQATLRTEFNFDNAVFYAKLRRRGFTVFTDAWANYPKTFQSMASTFNGGYLDAFKKTFGKNSSDKRPVFDSIENSVVQDRLRKLGYKFHNYGNWWEPTRTNKSAIVNYQGYPPDSLLNLSEFERALWRRTPTTKIIRLFTDAEDKRECRRIKRKFRRLHEIGNKAQPVFVLAHFVVPHRPAVMDAAGQCLEKPLFYRPSNYKIAYINYLTYFNDTILGIVDEQLRRRGRTGRKLLFVIQSDEGPFPISYVNLQNWERFSDLSVREIKMKMGTINALLLPGVSQGDIPTLGTPVNNWRIIFNMLSGSKMKLLPDRVFVYPTEKSIFAFCDVTEAVTKEDAARPSCLDKGEE